MERPVRCKFCGKRMYYTTNPEYDPHEVRVTVRYEDTGKIVEFYAHEKCWKTVMKKVSHVPKM